MSQFGKRVAWTSVILFGLSYFQHGPVMSLQRDYVGILPISVAIFLVTSQPQLSLSIRAFLVGILFGLSATIKPPLAIGLPLVLFFQWKQTYRTNTDETPITSPLSIALSISFFSFLGFAVPMFGSILWLWRQGSLPYLWEIYSSYIPLYLSLTGEHKTIFGIDRLKYLIESYLHLGGHSTWLIPACLGLFIASFDTRLSSSKKSIIYLLSGMTILYSIYPVFSGQFWPYHWMPFEYFIIVLASMILVRVPSQHSSPFRKLFPVFVLILTLVLVLRPSSDFYRQVRGLPPVAPRRGRVDKIAEFLKLHVEPGDKVQPLDWTGGVVHAMLLSRVEIATPFIYDFHFYHHTFKHYASDLCKNSNKQRLDMLLKSFIDTNRGFLV